MTDPNKNTSTTSTVKALFSSLMARAKRPRRIVMTALINRDKVNLIYRGILVRNIKVRACTPSMGTLLASKKVKDGEW